TTSAIRAASASFAASTRSFSASTVADIVHTAFSENGTRPSVGVKVTANLWLQCLQSCCRYRLASSVGISVWMALMRLAPLDRLCGGVDGGGDVLQLRFREGSAFHAQAQRELQILHRPHDLRRKTARERLPRRSDAREQRVHIGFVGREFGLALL